MLVFLKCVVVGTLTAILACSVFFRDAPKVAEWIDSGLNADGMTRRELIATACRQGFWMQRIGFQEENIHMRLSESIVWESSRYLPAHGDEQESITRSHTSPNRSRRQQLKASEPAQGLGAGEVFGIGAGHGYLRWGHQRVPVSSSHCRVGVRRPVPTG